MSNINFSLLKSLSAKKRSGLTTLTWQEIAEKCGIFGNNAGDRARCLMRTDNKCSKEKRKNKNVNTAYKSDGKCDGYGTQYSFCDENKYAISNATSTAVDRLDELEQKIESCINSNGTISNSKLIELSEAECKDSKVLLEKHGFNISEFELVSAKNTMWNTMTKKDGVHTLYSSKITVKPRNKNNPSIDDVKKVFVEMCETHVVPTCEPCKKYNKSGKLLEINIADLHLGKYATMATTNNKYGTELAQILFNDIIDDVIAKTKGYKLEKILLVFSNDFFNFDTVSRTTTSGTPQDYDITWQEVFSVGCKMLIDAIEKLTVIAPVETFYIGSNHDKQSAYYLICYLDAWFRNNPNVIIDTSPLSRKIKKFGNSLIYFMHGDMPKSQINGIIAREYPVEWGQTRFREIHAAHLHSDQSILESCGCICRFMPSVTGTDIWHYENGYTGTLTKSQSFIWDKEYGLEHIINTNIIK